MQKFLWRRDLERLARLRFDIFELMVVGNIVGDDISIGRGFAAKVMLKKQYSHIETKTIDHPTVAL